MKDIERMVISAHADGEVESPWKEQVERRIAAEAAWAAEAETHHRVKAALASSPEPDFRASQARVWERIASRSRREPSRALPLAWVSVAAAALLLVAAGAGFWVGRQSASPGAVEVSELQVQVPQQLELKLTGEGQLLMASTLQRTSP